MSEKKCLYCDKLCDGSDEHILQQGFGSTLSSEEVLCSACNGLFSKTLDELCVEKHSVLHNQLGISGKSEKGRKPGSGKTIITEKLDTLSEKVSFDNFYFKGIKKSLLNFVCYTGSGFRSHMQNNVPV